MAYGVRWYSYFCDIHSVEYLGEGEGNYLVEILERDFVGEPVRVKSADDPVVAELVDVTDIADPIRSMKFTFRWNAQQDVPFEISELFITDDRKYKFQITRLDSAEAETVLFYGYLAPIDCEEPFLPKPYAVQMAGTCGLPFLGDDYFLDEIGLFIEGKISLIKIIANCLYSTGHGLPIHTYINLTEEGMSGGSALALNEIDADGLRGMKKADVLEGILNTFPAYIVQSGQAWVIKSLEDQASENVTVHKFNANGDFIGTETVNQIASFGKVPIFGSNPRVKPVRKSVKETIAMQNSVVKNEVSPGIAVNRLPNGTFSGPVLGGNMSGWIDNFNALQHPTGAGWTRAGIGSPEDPYRVEITGADTYGSSGTPSNIHIPDPITIDAGVWDPHRETKIKLVFSGAYRAADISWFKLFVRLNDGDRDFVSYMDESGKWTLSKKTETYAQIDVDVPANPPNTHNFEDSPLQTFEITSDVIDNFLNRSGRSIAKLYFEVRAGYVTTDKTKFHTLNPKLSWEDFAVNVTTETKFEGSHTYQADAKFPIRNPNETSYQTIIADKIGIDTPEQSRPENRVMTGYMTRLDGSLTTGWKLPSDSSYEPIQKRSLRTRLRLLCSKRAVFDGTFMGYGLMPDHSVYNSYDDGESPAKFYTIEGWKWNLWRCEYVLKLSELRFAPLETEIIDLVDDEQGRRGNRMYAGSGGSSKGGSGGTTKPIEEITLNDPEPAEYVVLVEDEENRVLDIGALIESSHTPTDLTAQLISWPDWISEIEIYRGEDLAEEDIPIGGMLQIRWMGKPVKSGNFQIVVELIGLYGEDCMLSIPIIVTPSDEFTEEWPPVYDPFPVLYFQLGKETTTGFLITDYLTTEHVNLTYRFLGLPSWISVHTVVNDDMALTGHPTLIETRKVTLEIRDAINRISVEELTLQVIPATEAAATLIDTSLTPVVLGELPGSFELPAKWDTPLKVNGLHDKIELHVKGGGDTGEEVDFTKPIVLSEPSEFGEYRPLIDTDGITTLPGQFVLTATIFYKNNSTIQKYSFLLYDEEYLAKLKKLLTQSGTEIGEIAIDGTTSFVYPGPANLRAVVDGVDFDEIYLSVEKDGVIVGTEKHLTDLDPLVDTTFDVFDADQELEPGVYTFPVRLLLAGVDVFKRTDTFTIGKKDAEPMPVLSLATFKAGTTNAEILESNIPLKGAEFDLPANYTIVFNGFGPGIRYKTVEPEFYFMRGGSFAQVDIEQFTGSPVTVSYPSPVSEGKVYIFGNKSSLKIGDIHQAPSRVLAVVKARDEDGNVVGIAQADFSFRVALDPEDYSGLRFLTWPIGSPMTLIDANVPKSGRQYLMPPSGSWWTVSVRSFGGIEFDAVKVELSRVVGGIEQPAWVLGPDYIVYHNVGSVVTELTADDKAYILGMDDDSDGIRVVFRVGDNIEMPLDGTAGLGFWKITMIAYLDTVEVATLSATIELIEDVEPPIKDCCSDCECEGGGEWNGGDAPEW